MANKIFSIYSELPGESDQQSLLLVEIAATHIACLVQSSAGAPISAFELFGFKNGELEVEKTFAEITPHSRLLNEKHSEVRIYIHNTINVLVPGALYNQAQAQTYLDAATGAGKQVVTYTDVVAAFGGIKNVYGIFEPTTLSLKRLFPQARIVHTYSQLLTAFPQRNNATLDLLKVQFYTNYFIVLVVSGTQLLLVQTFEYDSPADVLYHLLNITAQLLGTGNPELEISGMIDLDSQLYVELKKYFNHVRVEEANKQLFQFDASEFPTHYFAPIVNLAV